jgi:hypothetical protein
VLLRNKPLEIVDDQRIALLLGQPAQRASRLRRLALKSDATTLECSKNVGRKREGRLLQPPPCLKLSLRSKPLEYVARARANWLLKLAARRAIGLAACAAEIKCRFAPNRGALANFSRLGKRNVTLNGLAARLRGYMRGGERRYNGRRSIQCQT